MSDSTGKTSESTGKKHTAGALDIRNIIGGLLAVYGIVLVATGLFGDKELDKTGDINANLWSGLALFVVGAAFLIWARLKPVVVPEHVDASDMGKPPGH